MSNESNIEWLLEGDISIQYQAHRDLLDSEQPTLRNRIAKEGWGREFLSLRKSNGHWGRTFYQQKWVSTHYTLMDLKNLSISRGIAEIDNTLDLVLKNEKGTDGGLLPHGVQRKSDVCVSAMVLNYSAYFGAKESDLKSIVDFLLLQKMPDGGFNCFSNRKGAVHSSLHTTISVAESILEYRGNGYEYRLAELMEAEQRSREFILQHRLFKSDKTGEIIDKKMLMLSYPSRWRYDILRALDYFQAAAIEYDERMADAIEVLLKKQKKDGSWPLQAKHPGKTHFEMGQTGKASRWNTLRALRTLKHFRIDFA